MRSWRLVPLLLIVCSCTKEPAPASPEREVEEKSVAKIVTATEPGQQGWTVVAWDATMPAAGALTIQMKDRDGSVQLLSTKLYRVAAADKFRVVFRYRVVGEKIEVWWTLSGSDQESTGECDVALRGESRSTISHNAIPMVAGEVFVPREWIPLHAVAWVEDSREYMFRKGSVGPEAPDLDLVRNGKKVDPGTYEHPWLRLSLRFEAS